eukprot:7921502-Ditylum_brightwellii.AAC.1
MSSGCDFSNDPWCYALLEATSCLREQNSQRADASLAYLGVLESRLCAISEEENTGDGWASIPRTLPPNWSMFSSKYCEDPSIAVSEALVENIIDDVDDAGDFPTIGLMDCRRLLI